MPFKTKKRGKLTYYFEGEDAVLSAMVVEEQADGDDAGRGAAGGRLQQLQRGRGVRLRRRRLRAVARQ